MHGSATMAAAPRFPLGAGLVLWSLLLLALFPVFLDIGDHFLREPWTRYSLLFPLLLGWAVLLEPPACPRSRTGILWLTAGLGLGVLAVAGDVIRLGRPGVALAVIGLCRLTGVARLPVALLALWAVPLPHFLVTAARPAVDGLLLAVGGSPEGLAVTDTGLNLVALLSGLGWFRGARGGGGLARCLRSALLWAAAALPVAALAVGLGALLVAQGELGGARLWLDHGAWIAVALGGLVAATRGRA